MVTEPCNARNISYNAWHRQVVAQQEVQLPLAEGQSWLGAKFVPSVRAQVVGADRSGQPLLSAELRHQLLVLGAGLLPAADDDAAGSSSSDRDIFQQAEFFRRCGFVRLPKLVSGESLHKLQRDFRLAQPAARARWEAERTRAAGVDDLGHTAERMFDITFDGAGRPLEGQPAIPSVGAAVLRNPWVLQLARQIYGTSPVVLGGGGRTLPPECDCTRGLVTKAMVASVHDRVATAATQRPQGYVSWHRDWANPNHMDAPLQSWCRPHSLLDSPDLKLFVNVRCLCCPACMCVRASEVGCCRPTPHG
jgi:hypothetical protein